ncbi:MAG: RAMP superfamily CRISPR-associated protein [Clostridiaceae bacterium]|nr:RAMP superfamily CRISPR-associated protein [Clostridiaceae bacterium]
MQNTIKLKIKTLSNLFIGGEPVSFEIGGIDQQTTVDQEGFPCIRASSLKGALRAVVQGDYSNMAERISQLYAAYLKKERETNWERIQELVQEGEALERIKKRYLEVDEGLSPDYLFGIKGFNNTPKLLFSDLLLCNEFRDKKTCFSIDMKNSIDTNGDAPISNPRTYKTARNGLVFEGEIRLYKIELLGEKAKELCKRYIIYNLMKFNNGIYRLGNSKSRGYGKVEMIIENEGGELKI